MSADAGTQTCKGTGEGFGRWLFGNAAGQGARRWALVPLRLVIGAMFAASGMQKAFGWFGGKGFGATVEMVREGVGLPLPGLFAVLLVLSELVGGIMLIVGVATRFAAAALAIAMVVALVTVKAQAGYFGTYLQQVILAGCVSLIIGAGGAACLLRTE